MDFNLPNKIRITPLCLNDKTQRYSPLGMASRCPGAHHAPRPIFPAGRHLGQPRHTGTNRLSSAIALSTQEKTRNCQYTTKPRAKTRGWRGRQKESTYSNK